MNFYKRFVGDIQKKTGHLSLAEFGAYDRFLDHCYATEKPLPLDMDDCCRIARAMTRDERKAVAKVLDQFFYCTEDGYTQSRVVEMIADAKPKIEANRINGLKGGRPKKVETITHDKPIGLLDETQSEPNDNLSQSQSSSLRSEIGPSGPVARVVKAQTVVDLFHEVLPELPKVRLLDDKRKKTISSFCRWVLTSKRSDGVRRAQTTDEALAWIRSYFDRARANDFLMGRGAKSSGHENWECDIDFLLSDKGKKHVIEKTRDTE